VKGATEADTKQEECMTLFDVSPSRDRSEISFTHHVIFLNFAAELNVFKSGDFNARNFSVKMKVFIMKC
jgi:hypothetical protein